MVALIRATKQQSSLSSLIHKLDVYSKPRRSTKGDFEDPSYFQAVLQGATEGAYIFGPAGILGGGASAVAGILVERKTHSRKLGVLAGILTGALICGVTNAYFGPLGVAFGAIGGGLLGAKDIMRGDATSKVRDAAGDSALLSALFIRGPGKLAGCVAAGIGSHGRTPLEKVALGVASGAIMGAALGAIGFMSGGILAPALIAGFSGGFSSVACPRVSQFFRNVSEDLGKWAEKGLLKLGIIKAPLSQRHRNAAGSVPVGFLREAVRGFLNSDFDLKYFFVGGASKAIQQAHVFLKSKYQERKKPRKAANTHSP